MEQTYPDPFQEAIHHGLNRALQIGAAAATAAQVYAYHHKTQARAVSERDERTRRGLNSQVRAERDAARSGWAPALDPKWLRNADLFDTAQAWGAAMPYADRDVPWYEPSAATAIRKCEDQLRHLHPYAMARYDRLRAEGLSPADAMRETAPLFAYAAHAHDTPPVSRLSLGPGDGTGFTWTASGPDPVSPQPEAGTAALERRGQQILAALQARARAQSRDRLGEDEQRTVLETITDLPLEVIERIVPPSTVSIAGSPAGSGLARGVQPWQNDFPIPIQDVVATAPRSGPVAAPSATRSRPTRKMGRRARRRT